MKFWKVLVFLSMPYLFLGCCKCVDYIIVSEHSYCDLTVDNKDTSLATRDKISTADTINAAHYGMRINMQTSEGLCKAPTTFFTSAYACKCPNPNRRQYKEAVESFNIKTVNDFDATHPAGSLVNEYFTVLFDINYTIEEFVQEYLSKEKEPLEYTFDTFDLKLLQAPDHSSLQSFLIEVTLSDSRTLTVTTKEVYLN